MINSSLAAHDKANERYDASYSVYESIRTVICALTTLMHREMTHKSVQLSKCIMSGGFKNPDNESEINSSQLVQIHSLTMQLSLTSLSHTHTRTLHHRALKGVMTNTHHRGRYNCIVCNYSINRVDSGSGDQPNIPLWNTGQTHDHG